MPWSVTGLPSHLMPVVEISRWPWMRDRHGAGVPHGVGDGLDVLLVHHQVVGVAVVASRDSSGASSRVTWTAGPLRAVSPAGSTSWRSRPAPA